MKSEPVSGAWLLGVEGCLEVGLALGVIDQRKVDFLGDKLEGAVIFVFSPSGYVASNSGPIAEPIIKLVIAGRQTGGVDVGMVEVDVSVNIEDGEVVAESGVAHLGMLQNPCDCVLFVSLDLRRKEPGGVILSNSDFQQISLFESLHLMGGCDNLPGRDVVVVGGVIGDDGAGSDEVVVLVEQDAGPRKLAGADLAVAESGHRTSKVPGSTLCLTSSCDNSFLTSLDPGNVVDRVRLQAGPSEHGQVQIGVVAAGLLAYRATCHLGF